jgi:hypothetical protein
MRTLLTASIAALLVTSFATAEPPADAEQQSSMFKRIFSYDKHLRESDKIVVLVVAVDASNEDAQSVASVFRAKGLFPAVVSVSSLNDDLTATLSSESTVVYVVEGVDYDSVTSFAESKGFLTISGLPSLAEEGHVSVAVGVHGNRPEIVVNLPRLGTEGHELSAELLKLARIVR